MVERKSGPVKPPIIDLKAQETNKSKASSKPSTPSPAAPAKTTRTPNATKATKGNDASTRDTKAPPNTGTQAETKDTVKPKNTPAKDEPTKSQKPNILLPITLSTLIGAALGVIAAYGLAVSGYWPQTSNDDPTAVTTEQLSQVTTQILDQKTQIDTLTTTLNDALQKLETNVAAQASAIDDKITAKVSSEINAMQTGGQTHSSVDLTPINDAIADLNNKLALLSTTPATSDDPSSVADITELQSAYDALKKQVESISNSAKTQEDKFEQAVASLTKTTKDTAKQLSEAAQSQRNTQVPLAISGLTAAFQNGQAYATELGVIANAFPKTDIPSYVTDNATKGVLTPQSVAQEFKVAVRSMTAAIPISPSASWQGTVLNRLKNAVALRPATAIDGDTPEAIISRLDQAITENKFSDALTLFRSLPEDVQNVAQVLADRLESVSIAQAFLSNLRTAALDTPKSTNDKGNSQ